MEKQGCYPIVSWIGSILLSVLIVIELYPFIADLTDWNWYFVWLAAMSATTFAMYGLDKLVSSIEFMPRVPEDFLHVMAALGGFPGGWAGMFLFNHKSNWGKHRDFPIILGLSTLGHIWLIWVWLSVGS